MTTAAIVGTGRMGSAMARALHAAGIDVVLQNRTRAGAEQCASDIAAGRVVDTPAEAAVAAEIIIAMLADDAAVRSAFLGRDGLVEGAGPRNVIVSMSTIEPATIQELAPAIRATGAGFLDAPVSGSVQLASTGTLTIMVGGDEADLDRARPILDALGSTIFHLGSLGTGSAMKLAVNTLIFAINSGLSEALVLAEAAGIPRARAYEVIAGSAAASPYVVYKQQAFLDPEGTAVGFALELAEKDLRLISETAERLGLDLPQTRATRQLVAEAAAGGRQARDMATVAGELRSRRRDLAAIAPKREASSN